MVNLGLETDGWWLERVVLGEGNVDLEMAVLVGLSVLRSDGECAGWTDRVDRIRWALHGDFPEMDIALVGQFDGASVWRLSGDVAVLLRWMLVTLCVCISN